MATPAPGAQQTPVGDLPRPGQRIGRYELRERVGLGGFGWVFRAWDPETSREVALKLLVTLDERARQRFAREIRAIARLRHPGIVTLLDSGEDRGAPYLVLELVHGRQLDECQDLSLRRRVELVREVALAVDYAHGEGVLHRDLKPQNVLVDHKGARLIDFGLARVAGSARVTVEGESYGTPAYMAPEQAGMSKLPLDERCDVYSLGATLYHAMSGEPPFEGAGMELFLSLFRDVPDPPSARAPEEVPPELDAVVLKCLEKAPADRYASCRALARDLERWLGGDPVAARPPSRVQRLRRGVSRRPHSVGFALGLGVGLLGGFLAGVGFSLGAVGPPQVAGAGPIGEVASSPPGEGRPQAERKTARLPLARDERRPPRARPDRRRPGLAPRERLKARESDGPAPRGQGVREKIRSEPSNAVPDLAPIIILDEDLEATRGIPKGTDLSATPELQAADPEASGSTGESRPVVVLPRLPPSPEQVSTTLSAPRVGLCFAVLGGLFALLGLGVRGLRRRSREQDAAAAAFRRWNEGRLI